jgi:hypothetical protein
LVDRQPRLAIQQLQDDALPRCFVAPLAGGPNLLMPGFHPASPLRLAAAGQDEAYLIVPARYSICQLTVGPRSESCGRLARGTDQGGSLPAAAMLRPQSPVAATYSGSYRRGSHRAACRTSWRSSLLSGSDPFDLLTPCSATTPPVWFSLRIPAREPLEPCGCH